VTELPTASILMSLYHRVDVTALQLCLSSLANQTRLPEQFVIIRDGPLDKALERCLDAFREQFPDRVSLVTLEENQGLIKALNAGLAYCQGDWIMRMDADDVAVPERVQTQLEFLRDHPDTDVLGSAMLEFDTDPTLPLRLKPVVEHHDEIKAQLPFRNPINHPTVCIRKSRLQSVNGYPALHYLEDYFLWVMLFRSGARFRNLSAPLHLYRFDTGTLVRRAGSLNFRNECKLRWWMFKHDMIGPLTLGLVVSLQLVLRFAPLPLRRFLWHISRQPVAPAQQTK